MNTIQKKVLEQQLFSFIEKVTTEFVDQASQDLVRSKLQELDTPHDPKDITTLDEYNGYIEHLRSIANDAEREAKNIEEEQENFERDFYTNFAKILFTYSSDLKDTIITNLPEVEILEDKVSSMIEQRNILQAKIKEQEEIIAKQNATNIDWQTRVEQARNVAS